MDDEIRLRIKDPVDPIPCPSCGEIMWYEDSTSNIMCKNDNCSVGLSHCPSGDEHINLWFRYKRGAKLEPLNIAFIREIMARLEKKEHLANNITTPPRGITTLKESEIAKYCKDKDITKKVFFEIRGIDQRIHTLDWVAAAYGIDEGTVKEIKRLQIKPNKKGSEKS